MGRLLRIRTAVAVALVAGLLLGLGAVAFQAQNSAADTARRVHKDDRIQLQQTLQGLTQQYLLLSLGELNTLASEPGWQLTAGSSADQRRLAGYIQASPLIGAGAQVVSLTGQPLTAYTRTRLTLPAATDPGFVPLRAALLAGQPGVSSVMASAGHELLAFGLPIRRGGAPAAVLLGYVDARNWPLQTYVAHLTVGAEAMPYVLDSSGVAVAAPQPTEVGHRVAGLPAAAPPTTVVQTFTGAGRSLVDSRGPVGLAGWQSVTIQPAGAYDGAFAHQHGQAQFALLALLLAACLVTAGGLGARYRRLAVEARRAMFDPLTGLAQRQLLVDRLDAALTRAGRNDVPLAVIYGDLNGFKAVNDTHGHRRGDALLAEVAHRLRDAVRPQDLVARLAGDEFVIVTEDHHDLGGVAVLAERIAARVAQPIELDRATVTVGISLGVIIATRGESGTVLEAADTAMYDAKRTHRPYIIRGLGALAHLSRVAPALRDDRPEPAVRV